MHSYIDSQEWVSHRTVELEGSLEMTPGGEKFYQTIFLYLKQTGPGPFPPFSSPVDYFALPELCNSKLLYTVPNLLPMFPVEL